MIENKTKLLIATDLHISIEDKIYSFEVLDEIIENAKSSNALLLLGDTFNTFKDLEALKDDFIKKVGDIPLYMLKGNHEEIGAHGINLSKLSFPKNINIIEKMETFNINNIEIAAFAYSEKYDIDNIKDSKNKRIFIGHGIVEGTIWAFEENETAASIPIDIIKKIKPELAVIGHIHKSMEINIDGIEIIYPGSSRVWRKSKSEQGQRKCLIIEIDEKNISKRYIELKSAGQYKIYDMNIDKNLKEKIKDLALTWSKNDTIDINLSGIIEDENALESAKEEIKNKYFKFLKEINVKNKNIILLDNAENESVITDFLYLYDEYISNCNTEENKEIVDLARFIGLEKISNAIKKNN